MLANIDELILQNKEKFEQLSKDKVKLGSKTTGTSIAAALHEEGIIIVADTQATLVEVGLKYKIETKITKIDEKTLFALAGVAQFIPHIKLLINDFKEWYRDLFRKEPSLKTIINYLRMQHQSNSWNYYAHIVLGGYCPIEKKYELYKLGSGDLDIIEKDPKKYTVLGSGTKYLLGLLGEGFKLQNFNEVKEKLILALRSAVNYDAYSGKDIECITLSEKGLETTIVPKQDEF
jgi:20S proteasome alpha/beta subunit